MLSENTGVSDRVFDALKNDPRTKNTILDITFNQGIVTLTGEVKSEEIRRAVEDIAHNQPEVFTVINELKIPRD